MQKVKKALRAFGYILLIVLASFGIGMAGGVPIPSFMGKKDKEQDNIELVEGEETKGDEVKP